jgi:hypothetical protein
MRRRGFLFQRRCRACGDAFESHASNAMACAPCEREKYLVTLAVRREQRRLMKALR